jgi:hypothetical protein
LFTLYGDRPEVIVQAQAVGHGEFKTNFISPAITETAPTFPRTAPLQSLFVPYDNDSYFRYRSDGWGEGEGDGDGSYEVGSVYDDSTRNGLVIGSIDHDTWKSAIRFVRSGAGELSEFRAISGVTSKYTHDTQPHGFVSGKIVQSPRMVIGWYDDWRAGMERFAEINTIVSPPLPWKYGVPFGWSSWSGHKDKVTAKDAEVATDFIHDDLPNLRSHGTAYINLDSFWDNLSEAQRAEFVRHAHSLGLKAGIYYTPFTGWGKLTDPMRGTPYKLQDMVLKDANGKPVPQLDGGWPIDPTHPGSVQRLHEEMGYFVKLGFDFVKIDFLTHGALEGKHYDPTIQTGNQAYAYGMKRILEDLSEKKAGRPIFVALSIAPMFPNGFGHSRRISCDIFANIGATEYLLNSANYGWWTNRLVYQFNDGDSSCVYQPLGEPPVSEAESRSRITASVICGGIVLEGDDLKKEAARERAKEMFGNDELLDIARKAVAFRPVYGDTGTKGGSSFVYFYPPGESAYVAVFNFDKQKANNTVLSLRRLGLPAGSWSWHDVWTKKDGSTDDYLNLRVPAMDCVLLHLQLRKRS